MRERFLSNGLWLRILLLQRRCQASHSDVRPPSRAIGCTHLDEFNQAAATNEIIANLSIVIFNIELEI